MVKSGAVSSARAGPPAPPQLVRQRVGGGGEGMHVVLQRVAVNVLDPEQRQLVGGHMVGAACLEFPGDRPGPDRHQSRGQGLGSLPLHLSSPAAGPCQRSPQTCLPVLASTGPTRASPGAWTTLASPSAGEAEDLLVREGHIVVTANTPGPFDRLGGRCLLMMRASSDGYSATGSCLLADADGDTIFERIEEASGKGHAVITGGTGKFAGLTGEYDFQTSDWYASVREGTDQGIGTKTGVWRMSGS